MGKTVSVTRPHNTSREAAMEKLKSLGQDAASKYGVSVQPTGTGANVDGRGISGGRGRSRRVCGRSSRGCAATGGYGQRNQRDDDPMGPTLHGFPLSKT